jgi:hypothetical protein
VVHGDGVGFGYDDAFGFGSRNALSKASNLSEMEIVEVECNVVVDFGWFLGYRDAFGFRLRRCCVCSVPGVHCHWVVSAFRQRMRPTVRTRERV